MEKKQKRFAFRSSRIKIVVIIAIGLTVFAAMTAIAAVPLWMRNVKLEYQKTMNNLPFAFSGGAVVRAEYDGVATLVRGDNIIALTEILCPRTLPVSLFPPKIPDEGNVRLWFGKDIEITLVPDANGADKVYLFYKNKKESVCFYIEGLKIMNRVPEVIALNGLYGQNKLFKGDGS